MQPSCMRGRENREGETVSLGGDGCFCDAWLGLFLDDTVQIALDVHAALSDSDRCKQGTASFVWIYSLDLQYSKLFIASGHASTTCLQNRNFNLPN